MVTQVHVVELCIKKTNICKILKFNKSYKTNVSFLVEGVHGGGGGLINFFVEKGGGLSEKETYKN